MAPKVSIGMSVYNADSTIRLAIESVVKQDFQDWELIVIDDGSHDGTVDVIREFKDDRIQLYIDGDNKGLSARLNQAIDLSTGKYFARMDADDVSYPNRLSEQVNFLETDDSVDLLSSKVVVVDEEYKCVGSFPYVRNHQEICTKPWSGFMMPHPTWIGKLAWFKKWKYSLLSKKSEDQELLLRSFQESNFHSIDKVLLAYMQPPLVIKKEWKTRLSKMQDIYRFYITKNRYIAYYGSIMQIVKLLYSVACIITPFTYYFLKHRACEVEDADLLEWERMRELFNLNDKHIK